MKREKKEKKQKLNRSMQFFLKFYNKKKIQYKHTSEREKERGRQTRLIAGIHAYRRNIGRAKNNNKNRE